MYKHTRIAHPNAVIERELPVEMVPIWDPVLDTIADNLYLKYGFRLEQVKWDSFCAFVKPPLAIEQGDKYFNLIKAYVTNQHGKDKEDECRSVVILTTWMRRHIFMVLNFY